MKALVTCLLIGLLLTGCGTLAPTYHRPPAPIPQQWPKGEAYQSNQGSAGTPNASTLGWQEFLPDTRLQKIMQMALKNNRDLRLAALNVERARAIYGVRRAELFPSVQTMGSFTRHRSSSDLLHPGEPRTTSQYQVSLGVVSWEIDFFGRIRSLESQALENYLATEEAKRSAEIALISEVARAYYALAADREDLKLAEKTLQDQQATYALIKKRYEVGFANELDLSRAQTQLSAAQRDIPRYTQRVARDLNALTLLTGAPIPHALLPPDLEGITPPRRISPGLPSEVLLKRPDIMAAEHQLKAAYASIGAARAAFFPRITLTTLIGTASDELSGLFDAGTHTWSFIPQAAMPIFDPRTMAAYRVSKALRKIALTRYEKTIQTAFREVSDALAVQGTIGREIQAQQSLLEAAERAYHLSLQRYNKGIDNYLSVLDAHRNLYLQQQILTALRLTKLANRVRLYAVLGGGSPPSSTKHARSHKAQEAKGNL